MKQLEVAAPTPPSPGNSTKKSTYFEVNAENNQQPYSRPGCYERASTQKREYDQNLSPTFRPNFHGSPAQDVIESKCSMHCLEG